MFDLPGPILGQTRVETPIFHPDISHVDMTYNLTMNGQVLANQVSGKNQSSFHFELPCSTIKVGQTCWISLSGNRS